MHTCQDLCQLHNYLYGNRYLLFMFAKMWFAVPQYEGTKWYVWYTVVCFNTPVTHLFSTTCLTCLKSTKMTSFSSLLKYYFPEYKNMWFKLSFVYTSFCLWQSIAQARSHEICVIWHHWWIHQPSQNTCMCLESSLLSLQVFSSCIHQYMYINDIYISKNTKQSRKENHIKKNHIEPTCVSL